MLEPAAASSTAPGEGEPATAALHSSNSRDAMATGGGGPAAAEAAVVEMDALQTQVSQGRPFDRAYDEVSGDMSGARGRRASAADYDSQFDTLDEPVWTTVRRDLSAIGAKLAHVAYPARSDELLRNWDLWGPLFLCVFVSLLLMQTGEERGAHRGPHFADVFIITFFGACVVTLNIKLLGGTISFFQALCVLGYCLLPPVVAAALCRIVVLMAARESLAAFAVRVAASAAGFLWATFASTAFLSKSQPARRRALAVYPIFLFYLVISWMIASHTGAQ